MQDSITNLLLLQLLTSNIDDLEPLNLFLFSPFTDINLQFVIKKSVLLFIEQVREVHNIEATCRRRQFYRDSRDRLKTADRDDSLLSIENFITSTRGVFTPIHEVHDIQWKTMQYRVNNTVALLVIINVFSLVLRTDIQIAIPCRYF